MSELNDWWWTAAPQLDSIRCPNEEFSPSESSVGRIWPWTIDLIGEHKSHYGYCRACRDLFWVGYHKTSSHQGDAYYEPRPSPLHLDPATVSVRDLLTLRIQPGPDLKAITNLASGYSRDMSSCNDDDWTCYSLLWSLVDCLLLGQEQALEGLIEYYYFNQKNQRRRGNHSGPSAPLSIQRPITKMLSTDGAARYLQRCEEILLALKKEVNDSKFDSIMEPWRYEINQHRGIL